nr:uncharacterized protein LOC128701920 [Cherax quadricarinatus]
MSITLASTLAFGVLSVGAHTAKVPQGNVTKCVSMLTPITLPQVSYNVASEIVCALLCMKNQALEYNFTGTTCTLEGEGWAVSARVVIFVAAYSPDMLTELPTGNDTYGSPYIDSNIPYLAVDNNITTYYHSNPGLVYPWWMLDLGDTANIHQVMILPRPGYFAYRFHNIEVRVGNTREMSGNFSSFTLFSTYKIYYSDTYGTLSCYRKDGVVGRYISIQRVTPEDDMLMLSDVRVFVSL